MSESTPDTVGEILLNWWTIRVVDEDNPPTVWGGEFETFKQWALDNGFTPGLAINRRDPELPDSPENCFVTERTKPVRSFDESPLSVSRTLNVDFDGDTPSGYPILTLPLCRQRQVWASKRRLEKLQRQRRNNMSLTNKVILKRMARLAAAVVMR